MLTNSHLRLFRDCPQKAYLSFDLGLEPLVTPEALRWGSAFHAALARIPYEADPYVRASVEAVISQYQEPCEIVAREVTFQVPFEDTQLAGSIDAIGRYHGRLVIVERKTTARPTEDLLQNLDIDTQVLTYWLGARAVGYDVESVLYCVQPRPSQRPLKATPEDKRRYTKEGKLYANQRLSDETPEEYAARLEIQPAVFREVAVLHDTLTRHLNDLHAQYSVLRSGVRWRNPQACESCWFTSICLRSDLENTVPDGFRRHLSPTLTAVSRPS